MLKCRIWIACAICAAVSGVLPAQTTSAEIQGTVLDGSGAVIPDSGRIFLDGEEVRFSSPADARRHRVEMVYQDLSLCDTIDVAGNLLLGREPKRRVLGFALMDKALKALPQLRDTIEFVAAPDGSLRVAALSASPLLGRRFPAHGARL